MCEHHRSLNTGPLRAGFPSSLHGVFDSLVKELWQFHQVLTLSVPDCPLSMIPLHSAVSRSRVACRHHPTARDRGECTHLPQAASSLQSSLSQQGRERQEPGKPLWETPALWAVNRGSPPPRPPPPWIRLPLLLPGWVPSCLRCTEGWWPSGTGLHCAEHVRGRQQR